MLDLNYQQTKHPVQFGFEDNGIINDMITPEEAIMTDFFVEQENKSQGLMKMIKNNDEFYK